MAFKAAKYTEAVELYTKAIGMPHFFLFHCIILTKEPNNRNESTGAFLFDESCSVVHGP